MRHVYLSIFLLTLISSTSSAAIKKVSDFSIAATMDSLNYALTLNPSSGYGSGNVRYQPNVSALAGGQVSLFGLTLSYKTPVKAGPQREEQSGGLDSDTKYGKTEYTDIRAMLTLGAKDQWFINAYMTSYKGFYIENTTEVDSTKTANDARIQRPDLSVSNVGGTVTYIFSPENLSVAAALSQTAKQTSRGGSLTLGLGYEQTRIKGDSAIVPSQLQSQYGTDAQMTEGTFSTASIIPGFGYSLAGDGPFVTVLVGVGLGSQEKTYVISGESISERAFAWKLIWSVSGGYNGDRLFAGATIYNDQTSFNTRSMGFTSQLYSLRVYAGLRF